MTKHQIDQQGSITIIMMAIVGVAVVVTAGLASIGYAYAAKARAQAVTDIAALYAAELVWNHHTTPNQACERAVAYAHTQGADVQQCHQIDESIQLTTAAHLGWGIGKLQTFEVSARAGPA